MITLKASVAVYTELKSLTFTFRAGWGVFAVCCRSSSNSSSMLLSLTSPLSSAPPTSSSFDVRGEIRGSDGREEKGGGGAEDR